MGNTRSGNHRLDDNCFGNPRSAPDQAENYRTGKDNIRDTYRADEAVYEGEILDQRKVSPNAKLFTRLLDDLFVIPGINLGVGLDGLLGLIPGVGDATTTTLSSFLFVEAIRNRVPIPVLLRMGLNLLLDALIGSIPFVGDLGDFAHRANRKNLRLIQQSIQDREATKHNSVVYILVAVSISIGTIIFLVAALIGTLWLLWQLLFG